MFATDRQCRRALLLGAAAAFAAPALAQSPFTKVETLYGIGASVPHRLYSTWADQFGPELGLDLNYVPLGSGEGRRAAIDREADFGGSDNLLDAADLAKADLVQVPTASAALGFVVNLPGIETTRLRLRRADIVGIFNGDIRTWSDPRLRATNPDLELPHLAITPILRRETSGSTSLVAAWLTGADAPQEAGSNLVDRSPGLAVFGAHGVALTVRRLRGSIGYLEASGARQFGLDMLDIERADGTFATLAQPPEAFEGEGGSPLWPLVIRTNILIPCDASRRHRSSMVARFFRKSLLDGGVLTAFVGYLPLPDPIRSEAVLKLDQLCEDR